MDAGGLGGETPNERDYGGAVIRRRAEGFEVTHDGRSTSAGSRGRQRTGLRPVHGTLFAAVMAASMAFAGYCGAAWAQVVEDAPVRHITVTLNKSKTLTFKSPFTTAVIGSPEIADLLPMTDHTLYVQGKKPGTTNISVFGAEKRLVAVVDLEVALDAEALHARVAASTGSDNIKVSSANGEVVLGGEASDAVSAARAVDVAKALSPKDAAGNQAPVIDAMRVAPTQQVMLKVRFVEVDRTAGRDLGVNFFGGNRNGVGVSGLGTPTNTLASGTISNSTGASVRMNNALKNCVCPAEMANPPMMCRSVLRSANSVSDVPACSNSVQNTVLNVTRIIAATII